MRLYQKILLLSLCSLLTACSKSPDEKDKTVEFRLPNGLQIVVKADRRAPIAVVQLWYKVGSADEPNGVTGIAHVTEHMMFQGSKHFPDNQYAKLVSMNGGNFNAQTYYDYTMFYQTIAANKLKLAMQLEADRMNHLTLAAKNFATEIQVVKEERRMRTDDDPQGKTIERFYATAFISSPYHHAPIGWMKDLNAMTVQDVQQWYTDWYAPNNAILVVVGDVDPQKVYNLAEKYFGPIAPRKLPILKPLTDETPLGLRTVTVNAPAQLPWLVMGFTVPTATSIAPAEKWQSYALEVLQQILAGSDSSLLEQQLVRQQQIASSVDVSYEIYRRLDTLFTISAIPAQGYTNGQVQAAVTKILQQVANTPVSETQLTTAKTQLRAQTIFADDDQAQEATNIGQVMVVGLPWQEINNYQTQIQKVTAAQVQAVAKLYLTPMRETVGYLVPQAINASVPSLNINAKAVEDNHVS